MRTCKQTLSDIFKAGNVFATRCKKLVSCVSAGGGWLVSQWQTKKYIYTNMYNDSSSNLVKFNKKIFQQASASPTIVKGSFSVFRVTLLWLMVWLTTIDSHDPPKMVRGRHTHSSSLQFCFLFSNTHDCSLQIQPNVVLSLTIYVMQGGKPT